MPPKKKDASNVVPGALVLAKVKGYPPWPARILPDGEVPDHILEIKPARKAALPVFFYPTSEFGWFTRNEMTKLEKKEIEAYLADNTRKKGSEIYKAYEIALDPDEWEKEALKRVAEVRAEQQAKQHMDVDDEDHEEDEVDELDEGSGDEFKSNEEAPKPKKKKSNGSRTKKATLSAKQKRKRGMDSSDEDEKPKKTKGSTKKAKKAEDDEEKSWFKLRHDIQRALVDPPKNGKKVELSSLPLISDYFKKVEECPLNINHLRTSKLGKLMKYISVMPEESIPQEDEYKFRERARKLMDKFRDIIEAQSEGQTQGNGHVSGQDATNDDESFSKVEVNPASVNGASKDSNEEEANEDGKDKMEENEKEKIEGKNETNEGEQKEKSEPNEEEQKEKSEFNEKEEQKEKSEFNEKEEQKEKSKLNEKEEQKEKDEKEKQKEKIEEKEKQKKTIEENKNEETKKVETDQNDKTDKEDKMEEDKPNGKEEHNVKEFTKDIIAKEISAKVDEPKEVAQVPDTAPTQIST